MYRTAFPDIDLLREKIKSRGKQGWPTCILHVKTTEEYRPDIRGPLSLFINLKGQSQVRVGAHQTTVDDQHYFLTNSGEHYNLQIDSESQTETFNIHIEERLTEQVYAGMTYREDQLLDQPDMVRPENPGFFTQLYRRDPEIDLLMQQIIENDRQIGTDQLLLQEQMSSLVVHLGAVHQDTLSHLDRLAAIRPATRNEIYRRVSRARDYLHGNLSQEVQLEDMASIACMSRYHFLRAFRQTFRRTPYQYLKELRMEKARKMLSGTDLPVSSIGFSLGYQNLSSFSRVFRQCEGVAPAIFRQMQQ
jgi:AraC family transcriptional regulator